MNTRNVLIALGCLTAMSALPAVSDAQITHSGGGYLFRAQWIKGAQLNYAMTTVMPASKATGGQGMNVAMSMKTKVLSVTRGIATVQVVSGSPMMNGKPMGVNPPPVTMTVDSRNKVISGAAGSNVSSPLPEKPLRVGESWSATVPMPQGGMSVHTVYTFLGMKNVRGRSAAQIALTISGPANGTGTMYLAASDGQMVSMKMDMSIKAGAQGTMNMTMTLKRQ